MRNVIENRIHMLGVFGCIRVLNGYVVGSLCI